MAANDSPILITPVVCAGAPYQMGCVQGERFKDGITGVYEALREVEAFCQQQPWFLPFALFRRIAAWRARRSLSPAVESACWPLSQRLLGIAHGSELSVDALWLMNALEGLLATVKGITVVPRPGGCSAVAIRGKKSQSGEPVLVHNFDYLTLFQPYYIVRETRPEGGYRSIEFTVAPLVGAIDGVNEKGLAVTYNYAQTLDEDKPDPTISMRIGQALSRLENVADAIEWLTSCPRWGSGLLMLADAGGDIASLELSNSQAEARRPADGEDYLFHANKFRCKSTIAVEVSEKAIYDRRAPKPLRGHGVLDSSLLRMARFTELLAGALPLSLEGLGTIMADHGKDGQPSDCTICMHSDFWVTTASIQCLPRTRSIRVSYGTACQANYVDFAL
jgi:hypothetical protein